MIVSVILLVSISVLVMAEEFEELPELLQKVSYTLVHNHRSRTVFVCSVILLMSLASSIGLIGQTSHSLDVPPGNDSGGGTAETKLTQEIILNLVLTLQQNITINEKDVRVLNQRGESLFNRLVRSVDTADFFMSPRKSEPDSQGKCMYPEYVVFTWVLCLIALAAALKLYYLIKTFLAILLVGIFTILVLFVCDDTFSSRNQTADQ